ncbi:MAG: ABC transporter ATP-binding protein [Bacteroidota bacterium]
MPTLRRVSLDVRRGEFLSVVGPNGSGKSTLLKLLDRILLPSEGSITLLDRDLAWYPRAELARKVSYVPQETGILFPYTVYEVVLMGRAPHSRGEVFENARDRAIAREAMRAADIAHCAAHPVTALSGGEKQRVFIARALAQQPQVILLDEPNAHLDIAHQVGVFSVMRRLNRSEGVTVVSVSHDLNLASAFSDRIVMLKEGFVVALGTPSEVLTGDRIAEVFGTDVLVDAHPRGAAPRVTLLARPA